MTSLVQSPPLTFIRVMFGEGKVEFFNPDCRVKVLVENIRARCDMERGDVVELADTQGTLQNLSDAHLGWNASASVVLTQCDRGDYILLKIRYDTEGKVQHIPLLKKACLQYPTILDHLEIPAWVEGANQKSSTRKLNKLRNATKLTMSMIAREKAMARSTSANKKVARARSGSSPNDVNDKGLAEKRAMSRSSSIPAEVKAARRSGKGKKHGA